MLSPLLSLPPFTEIGVVAEGVMVNVSLPVAFGSTPIEADWALSVPSIVTVAPLEASLVLAVIVIGEVAAASIVEPDAMFTLLAAVSVTDEPDWMVTPLIASGPWLCSVTVLVRDDRIRPIDARCALAHWKC